MKNGSFTHVRRSQPGRSQLVRWLLAALFLIAASGVADAEPYLAVREGFKCSQCHVNITGGGKRNAFGVAYSQTRLPMTVFSLEGLDPGSVSGDLTKNISIGTNFRTSNTTVFVPSGPLSEDEDTNEFDVDEAVVYLEVRLLGDRLTLYLDERLAPGSARTREAFGLLRGLPGNAYLKAGRFFLPYGLRLQDDTAFIREQTGINFESPDIGLEAGAEPGPFSFSVSVSNGTAGGAENNTDKAITLIGQYVRRSFRLGGSFGYNDGPDGDTRTLGGIFGAGSYGKLGLMTELDWIKDEIGSDENQQLAFFIEGNVEVIQGFNTKLTYEWLDPDDDVDEDEQTRWSIIAEAFLTQFAQVRLGGRIADAPPQLPAERADTLFVELHLFL